MAISFESRKMLDMNYFGGKPGLTTDIIARYMTEHPEEMEKMSEVNAECRKLVFTYKHVVPERVLSRAKALVWRCYKNVAEYRHAFLTNVLMESYRVFDASHQNYEAILDEIRINNPEWEADFKRNHQEKMRVCKAPIFPC